MNCASGRQQTGINLINPWLVLSIELHRRLAGRDRSETPRRSSSLSQETMANLWNAVQQPFHVEQNGQQASEK